MVIQHNNDTSTENTTGSVWKLYTALDTLKVKL